MTDALLSLCTCVGVCVCVCRCNLRVFEEGCGAAVAVAASGSCDLCSSSQAVYNVLSFSLASMMATTMFLWFRSFAVKDRYQSAVIISGLVTFIAAYHYIRIFNSWVDAYQYTAGSVEGGAYALCPVPCKKDILASPYATLRHLGVRDVGEAEL